MVFQNYALYPHMTVFDNMAFGLKLQKMPQGARSTSGSARRRGILGLDELLARKPAALSGGQRQRVAMGRAIVRHPQAFLMDEPLSNLDAKLRVQMRSEIARIQHDLGCHDDLRHPRPDRGHDDGRPGGGDPQGRAAAGRRAADALRAPRERVRRRLHRLAGDEPLRGARSTADGDGLAVEFGGFRLPDPGRGAGGPPRPAGLRRPHGRARHPARGHGGRVARRPMRRAERRISVHRSSCARRSAPTSSCTSASTHRRP